jgi:hypothetical protein
MHLHHLKGAGRAALIAAGLGMALGFTALALSGGFSHSLQGSQSARFTEAVSANRPGRVLGQIEAVHGDTPMPLPGALVSLRDLQNRVAGESAGSDVEGRYEIRPHPPGTYRLCADAPGLVSTCAPNPVVIKAETQYLNLNDQQTVPIGTVLSERHLSLPWTEVIR